MEVCIKKENGQFSVGAEPADSAPQQGAGMGGGMASMMGQEAPEGQEDQGMKPAKDLEDALNQARQLLSGGEGGGDPNEMWNRVQRDRAIADQPGGPMMGMPR
jgi:hypothetical protein